MTDPHDSGQPAGHRGAVRPGAGLCRVGVVEVLAEQLGQQLVLAVGLQALCGVEVTGVAHHAASSSVVIQAGRAGIASHRCAWAK
jgi:hypothetical protein